MSASPSPVALVLGASGAIGAAIAGRLAADGFRVIGTSRRGDAQDHDAQDHDAQDHVAVDPYGPAGMDSLDDLPELSAAVWAQGTNLNDSVGDLDLAAHDRLLQANVGYVSATLGRLTAGGRLRDGARLVVLSSIWQHVARTGKFSYTVSKAAVGGLVRAAAVDLAPRRILVNAVLPGVVDTEMTRGVLSEEQMERVRAATGFGRLVTLSDVANTVGWLCSPDNTGVTGQSVEVDLGFAATRTL